ncbi:MAG: hypothetical protein AAB875_03435 [Patescibacteria group bacterium]
MPKNRIILVLGVLIALLPVLGFPRSWESFFQISAGLSIVLLSVWSTIDKKLMLKAKAQMRQARKTPLAPGIVPPVTDEFGKRVSDINPTITQPQQEEKEI